MTNSSGTKHRATVEWDGHYWVATPDSGGATQAKRLDQLPDRLVEVIQLMTGDTVDPESIGLDIHYDDEDLALAAADLRQRRADLEACEQELADRTAATARSLRARGMNLRDIGTLMGMSYQRVHQLVG